MHTHTRIHTHTHNTDAKGQGDFGLRWNQIVSALVADDVVFNSNFNMNSFLSNIPKFLNIIPKHSRPNKASILNSIAKKSRVLYYPLSINRDIITQGRINKLTTPGDDPPLRIVWPHRWEHDKGLNKMITLLYDLRGLPFELAILGQDFAFKLDADIESMLTDLKRMRRVTQLGFVESREKYLDILEGSDVVLSTALHEFYGVSTLEAVWLGCLPLCPNRLAYPEFFPKECLYNTDAQLKKKLKSMILYPKRTRERTAIVLAKLNMYGLHWDILKFEYSIALGFGIGWCDKTERA